MEFVLGSLTLTFNFLLVDSEIIINYNEDEFVAEKSIEIKYCFYSYYNGQALETSYNTWFIFFAKNFFEGSLSPMEFCYVKRKTWKD